jgi:predicted transcriptional regulator of viral defense system
VHLVSISEPRINPAGIGKRNRGYLERLHRQTLAAFDVATAADALELDRDTTARLLGYLARRGWLSRVRRGLYVAVPLDARQSGEWIEDSWIVADQIFSPCYIGGWSACEHWDLTEQVFRTQLVVTARKVHERDITLQGIPIRLTVRPTEKHFGTVPVWRGQARVAVSDPSRTVVDILDDPRLGGGIRMVADIIQAYTASRQRDDALLVQYGDRLGNRSVFKRLGYLLEQSGADVPKLIAACLERRSTGLTTLDPSVRADGRILRRWGLRINVTLRPEG